MTDVLYCGPTTGVVATLEAAGLRTVRVPSLGGALRTLEQTPRFGLLLTHESLLAEEGRVIALARELGNLERDLPVRPELWVLAGAKGVVHTPPIDGVVAFTADGVALTGPLLSAVERARRLRDLVARYRTCAAHMLSDTRGVFNQRYLRVRLGEELSRATREARPLSLMLVEWTRSRSQTHSAEALAAEVRRRIADTLRPYDVLCTFGPQRLAVILTDVEPTTAFALSRRIRVSVTHADPLAALDDERPDLMGLDLRVGLVGLSGEEDEGDWTVSTLLAEAEGALSGDAS